MDENELKKRKIGTEARLKSRFNPLKFVQENPAKTFLTSAGLALLIKHFYFTQIDPDKDVSEKENPPTTHIADLVNRGPKSRAQNLDAEPSPGPVQKESNVDSIGPADQQGLSALSGLPGLSDLRSLSGSSGLNGSVKPEAVLGFNLSGLQSGWMDLIPRATDSSFSGQSGVNSYVAALNSDREPAHDSHQRGPLVAQSTDTGALNNEFTVNLGELALPDGTNGLDLVQFVSPRFVMPTPAAAGIAENLSDGLLALLGLLGGRSVSAFAGGGLSSSGVGGIVIDGYISGAQVYRDDGTGNPLGGVVLTTDATGHYGALPKGSGKIVVVSTVTSVDTSTGQPFTSALTLEAPSGSTVVNPITTMIQASVESGNTLAQATTAVMTGLGLPSTINYLSYDPIGAFTGSSGADQTVAFQIQKVATQIANLIITASADYTLNNPSSGYTTAQYSAAVVQNLTKAVTSSSAAVDLTNTTTLGTVLPNVDASAITLISNANHIIGTTLQSLYDVQTVIQGDVVQLVNSSSANASSAFAAISGLVTSVQSGIQVLNVGFTPSENTSTVANSYSTAVNNPIFRVTLKGLSSVKAGNIVTVSDAADSIAVAHVVSAADITAGYVDIELDNIPKNSGVFISAVVEDSALNQIAKGFFNFTHTVANATAAVSISSEVSNNSASTFAKVGDTVSVAFKTAQPVTGVSIGGHTATVTQVSGQSNSYLATYTVQSGYSSSGSDVVISYTNATGDQASFAQSGAVTILTSPPTAPALTIAAASENITLVQSNGIQITGTKGDTVSVTFTDSAGHTVTKSIVATGSKDNVSLATTDLLFNNPSSGLKDGSIIVSAIQSDPAGNVQTVTPASGSFTLNTSSPVVNIESESTSNSNALYAKVGDTLTTTFTSTDNVTSVTIGGQAASLAPGTTSNGVTSYTATRIVASGNKQGAADVVVVATNSAGNSTTSTLSGSVIVDTVSPSVVIASETSNDSVGSTFAVEGNTVTATFTSTDPVISATIDGQTATVTAGTTTNGVTSYTASYVVVSADVASHQGAANVVVVSRDAAGNQTTQTLTGTVSVDTVAPEVAITGEVTSNVTNAPSNQTHYAKAGDTITVSFTSTDPVTSVTIDGQTAIVIAGTTTSGVTSYTATHIVSSGGETQGVANVVVTSTDRAGNISTQTLAGLVTVDTVAPVLNISSESTSNATQSAPVHYAKAGDTVTTAFTSTDTVTSVKIAGNVATINAPNDGSNNYTATYQVSGANEEVQGTQNVIITSKDTAGNETTQTFNGTVILDTVAPSVVINSETTSNSTQSSSGIHYAKAGDTITTNFTSSDPVTGVTIDGKTASVIAGASVGGVTSYTATYQIQGNGAESQGLADVVVTSTDTAGNVTNKTLSGAITVDTVAPSLTILSESRSGSGAAGYAVAGDTITTTFTSTDPVTSITIDGVAVPSSGISATSSSTSGGVTTTTYTATHSVTSNDIQGAASVVVSSIDASGNLSTKTSAQAGLTDIIVDSAVLNSSPIQIVNVTSTSTSFIALKTESLSMTGGSVSSLVKEDYTSDSNYYKYTINWSSFSSKSLVIQAQALANAHGNVPLPSVATISQYLSLLSESSNDTDANGNAIANYAKPGSVISVVFSCQGTVSNASNVLIDGHVADNLTVTATSNGITTYSATLTVASGYTQGTADVTVTSTDPSNGVVTTLTLPGTVKVDTVAPTVLISTESTSNVTNNVLSPVHYAKAGDTITTTFSSSDPVTSVTVDGQAATVTTGTTTNGVTSYTARYVVSSTDVTNLQGLANIVVKSTDAAGNLTTQTLSGLVVVDTLAPTVSITSESTSNASGNVSGTHYAKAGDTITTTFTSSDPVNSVTIGGQAAALTTLSTDSGVTSYRATHVVSSSGEIQGAADVVVTSTDAAGNLTAQTLSGAVVIDTVAPTVSISSESTSNATQTAQIHYVKAGETVTASFTSTDPVTSVTIDGQAAVLSAVSSLNGVTTYTATHLVSSTGETQGAANVVVTSTDSAGNTSTQTLTGTVLVDTVAPTVVINAESTSNATQNSSGTHYAKAGDTITTTFTSTDPVNSVMIGGKSAVLTTGITTNGVTSYSATRLVESTGETQAAANVVVTSTDTAGNLTVQNLAGTVTVDTNAPVAPAVTGDTSVVGGLENPSVKTGESLAGQVISGTAEAYSFVTITDTVSGVSQVIGTTQTDASGNFTLQPSTAISSATHLAGQENSIQGVSGVHTLTAKATDAAGNVSSVSTSNLAFTLNTVSETLTTNSISIQQGSIAQTIDQAIAQEIGGTSATTYTYSFVNNLNGLFAINAQTGSVSLTKVGAEALAANPQPYTLQIQVADNHGGVAVQNLAVSVTNAISGDTGTLPGTMGSWDIAPSVFTNADGTSTNGYILTSTTDSNLYLNIPGNVTTLNFSDGNLALNSNDGTIGTFTVNPTNQLAAGTTTINVTPGLTENVVVNLPTTGNETVIVVGTSNSALDPFVTDANGNPTLVADFRSDVVNVNASSKDVTFTANANNTITMTLASGVKAILSGVEAVTFTDHTFSFVGENAYSSVAEATANFPGSLTQPLTVFSTTDGTLRMTTPLVLDLTGAGIQTTSLGQSGVTFDLTNSGIAGSTGWITPGEGFLVHLPAGATTLINGSELFGSATILPNGQTAANGFAALAAYDVNGSGVINASDPIFNELRVWVDTGVGGVNGTTPQGKLYTLSELGIVSLNLNATQVDQANNGNVVGLISSYTTVDGQTHELADVWLTNTSGSSVNSAVSSSDVPNSAVTNPLTVTNPLNSDASIIAASASSNATVSVVASPSTASAVPDSQSVTLSSPIQDYVNSNLSTDSQSAHSFWENINTLTTSASDLTGFTSSESGSKTALSSYTSEDGATNFDLGSAVQAMQVMHNLYDRDNWTNEHSQSLVQSPVQVHYHDHTLGLTQLSGESVELNDSLSGSDVGKPISIGDNNSENSSVNLFVSSIAADTTIRVDSHSAIRNFDSVNTFKSEIASNSTTVTQISPEVLQVNTAFADASFIPASTSSSSSPAIQMLLSDGSSQVLSGVKEIQFNDQNLLVVGPGGFSSIEAAESYALPGDSLLLNLPGKQGDWTVEPLTDTVDGSTTLQGYALSDSKEGTSSVFVPSNASHIVFADGGDIALGENTTELLGQISYLNITEPSTSGSLHADLHMLDLGAYKPQETVIDLIPGGGYAVSSKTSAQFEQNYLFEDSNWHHHGHSGSVDGGVSNTATTTLSAGFGGGNANSLSVNSSALNSGMGVVNNWQSKGGGGLDHQSWASSANLMDISSNLTRQESAVLGAFVNLNGTDHIDSSSALSVKNHHLARINDINALFAYANQTPQAYHASNAYLNASDVVYNNDQSHTTDFNFSPLQDTYHHY